MEINSFPEIALVLMKRNRIQFKDLALHIGTSIVYARQVVNGETHGKKAELYRLEVANYLGIDKKYLK